MPYYIRARWKNQGKNLGVEYIGNLVSNDPLVVEGNHYNSMKGGE